MRSGVPYNHEEHVKLCELVGARLPSKFMLFPTIVAEGQDEFVWTDILFMRTLNMQTGAAAWPSTFARSRWIFPAA